MFLVIKFLNDKLIPWFVGFTYAYFCLIILVEVVRRYVFGDSSPWGEMTARYAFVYLTYVAAAEGVRQGRHIKIDLVPNLLSPFPKFLLRLYTDALILVLAALVIYFSLELIDIQWSAGIIMPAADLNMAFAHSALPLGWSLIIIRVIQNWFSPIHKMPISNSSVQ